MATSACRPLSRSSATPPRALTTLSMSRCSASMICVGFISVPSSLSAYVVVPNLSSERLLQICKQVFDRFDAHRQADQAVGHSRLMAGLRSHSAVAGHRRPCRQALHAAQTDRMEDQPETIQKPAGCRLAPAQFEREQSPAMLHLPAKEFGLGMRFNAGIMPPRNLWLAAQPLRDGLTVAVVCFHSQGKGPQPPEHQPGIESIHGSSKALVDRPLHRRQGLLAHQTSANHVGMTVEVFARRVNNPVRSDIERTLIK